MDIEAPKKNKIDYLFDVDFKKYYLILIKQKSFIFIFCCSAMLSSLVLTYFFSEKFVAGTSIYYHPIESSVIKGKETRAFGSPAPATPFKVIAQTLSDIAKSDTILLPVVKKLHLDQPVKRTDAAWYVRFYDALKNNIKECAMDLWSILKYGRVIEPDSTQKAIQKLRKNFKLKATKESYVYIVTVKDKFPARAAAIVDEVSSGLVAWLRGQDIKTASGRLHHIKEQLSEKEVHLNNLRTKQENVLKENNLVEVSEELSRIVENLYGLENEYIRISAEIERKKAIIDHYAKTLKQKVARKIHPEDIKRINSEKIFEEIYLNGLTAQNTSLKHSMDDLKKRMSHMLTIRKQIESLSMKIEADIREYSHLKDMYLENLSQLTGGDSEVEVMHAASVPAKPAQPIKIYHVGLTGLLSVFFATGLIYVFAFFNIRMFFDSHGVKGRKK